MESIVNFFETFEPVFTISGEFLIEVFVLSIIFHIMSGVHLLLCHIRGGLWLTGVMIIFIIGTSFMMPAGFYYFFQLALFCAALCTIWEYFAPGTGRYVDIATASSTTLYTLAIFLINPIGGILSAFPSLLVYKGVINLGRHNKFLHNTSMFIWVSSLISLIVFVWLIWIQY